MRDKEAGVPPFGEEEAREKLNRMREEPEEETLSVPQLEKKWGIK